MTDLGLSNGYFCVVEQDDMFKFLIDYVKRRPDSPIDYHVSRHPLTQRKIRVTT